MAWGLWPIIAAIGLGVGWATMGIGYVSGAYAVGMAEILGPCTELCPGTTGFLVGTFLALVQWRALGQWVSRPGWWLLPAGAGWAIGATLATSAPLSPAVEGPPAQGTALILSLAAYQAVTAVTLGLLLAGVTPGMIPGWLFRRALRALRPAREAPSQSEHRVEAATIPLRPGVVGVRWRRIAGTLAIVTATAILVALATALVGEPRGWWDDGGLRQLVAFTSLGIGALWLAAALLAALFAADRAAKHAHAALTELGHQRRRLSDALGESDETIEAELQPALVVTSSSGHSQGGEPDLWLATTNAGPVRVFNTSVALADVTVDGADNGAGFLYDTPVSFGHLTPGQTRRAPLVNRDPEALGTEALSASISLRIACRDGLGQRWEALQGMAARLTPGENGTWHTVIDQTPPTALLHKVSNADARLAAAPLDSLQ